jgi:cobalt/nickel transport system ATP-binding protein
MSHHIVEATDLRYTYPDGTTGLNGISFRITHGESVALVGENGAGKSTLLLHMTGYLIASQGKMRVGDVFVSPTSLQTVRRSVGMVFQNSDDQLFMPTVFEDVAFGPINLGIEKEELEHKVMESLERVGAAHLRNRPPYRLSQGEKKAVAIATVLAMSPDILIMDEPTSSLDPQSRRRLIELLMTFQHTKIIATHDLDMAMDLCERTIMLHEGRVVADGPTAKLMQDDELLHGSRLERPLRMQGCPVCGTQKQPWTI